MIYELYQQVEFNLDLVYPNKSESILPSEIVEKMEEGLIKNPSYVRDVPRVMHKSSNREYDLTDQLFGKYENLQLKIGIVNMRIAERNAPPMQGVGIMYAGTMDNISSENLTERMKNGIGLTILLENGAISGYSITPALCIPLINSWYPLERPELGVFPHPEDRTDVEYLYKDIDRLVPEAKGVGVYNAMSDMVMLSTYAWNRYQMIKNNQKSA